MPGIIEENMEKIFAPFSLQNIPVIDLGLDLSKVIVMPKSSMLLILLIDISLKELLLQFVSLPHPQGDAFQGRT